jgi:pilus assembly protein CpaC
MRFPLTGSRRTVRHGLWVLVLGLALAATWASGARAQEVKKLRVAVGRSAVLTLPDSIGTVSIADDKIADVVVATPYQVLIIGKKVGISSLVVWGKGNRYTNYDLIVHRAEAAGNQIVLSVTVAEINRTRLAERGVDFGILKLGEGRLGGNLFGGSFAGEVAQPNFPLFFSSNVTLALDYISLASDLRVQAIIHALEQDGTAKVLANPNLVAVNGQAASFLSGGEIPIPIQQSMQVGGSSATGSVTVLFKEYGAKVDFEPTVIDSNIVSLKVKPELSRPDYQNSITLAGYSIPSFITRRVETVVEMREGESLIIGGLKEQQRTKTVRGVPLLKDIPVLGNLFKNVREETSEQELVVMVTPRFVKPLSADQVPEFPSLVDPKK